MAEDHPELVRDPCYDGTATEKAGSVPGGIPHIVVADGLPAKKGSLVYLYKKSELFKEMGWDEEED